VYIYTIPRPRSDRRDASAREWDARQVINFSGGTIMNEIIKVNRTTVPAVFMFESNEIRTITDETGAPWWVAKDVAEILGYSNTNDAINRHCRGVAKHYPIIDALGRQQEARIISEPDLYRLISGSKLPAALRFEKWIFEEVLPSIRKTGGYNTSSVDMMELLNDQTFLRTALLTYTEKVLALEAEVKQQAPKVAALERIAGSDGMSCITDTAKALQMRPKDLFVWMQGNGWIYRRPGGKGWIAYQARLQQGVLSHKVITVSTSDGREKAIENVLVTPKGLARLAAILQVGVASAEAAA
jgi:anti-repressor protein